MFGPEAKYLHGEMYGFIHMHILSSPSLYWSDR